jgi:hypothetical protein
MRKHTAAGEAFLCDPKRWVVIGSRVAEFKPFGPQALEAGYVWDERTRHTSGGKSISVPLKDGWFEHVMNCAEYTELNFGRGTLSVEDTLRRAEKMQSRRVRLSQKDADPFRWPSQAASRRGGY